MEYRPLGYSGMKMSAMSIGAWRTFAQGTEQNEVERIMAECMDNGINTFDGAESYGLGEADECMGRCLKNLKWPREHYIMISKASPFEYGMFKGVPTLQSLSRKKLTESCNAALRRLGLDYLDIFYCHRPHDETALEDIVITMNALIQQGKIMYWGTSEFSAGQLLKLWEIARDYKMSPPVVEQTGHNLLGRWRMERDLPPVFEQVNMGTMTYRPLMSGILTGKFLDDANGRASEEWDKMAESEKQKVRQLKDLADELGISQTQLSFAWIMKNPNVTSVLTGSSRPGQITESVKAVDALPKLTDEVMESIETLLDNHPCKTA
jgi:aryl-alcohol dehydrogenase-like predicted oxidoreductase